MSEYKSLILLPDTSPVVFPSHDLAMDKPEGLLCLGGNLEVETLLNAYESGIFPWYSDNQPILWWTPETRAIFKTDQIHISKNMRKLYRQNKYEIVFDCDFQSVIKHCSKRIDGSETWILPEVIEAYSELFRQGVAHSVEVYDGATLVGGLYGVFIKNVFCGESMFSLRPNTSKLALFELANLLQSQGCNLIDCQMINSHLLSLGAMPLARNSFLETLGEMNDNTNLIKKKWCNVTYENKIVL